MDKDTAPGTESVEPQVAREFTTDAQHLRLTQAVLADQTDHRNEVAYEVVRLLHPSESLQLQGNLFALEDTLTGAGTVLVRLGPLPHARPVPCPADLRVAARPRGFTVSLLEPPAGEPPGRWAELAYEGGEAGRIRALHDWQRRQRPATGSHALPTFLTNTWGDRSKDSRICEAFITAEIEAAARLGADVVQIDDGWQAGVTQNSATPGGAFEGFWNRDPGFWLPHSARFPNGLAPLAARARARKVRLGLWFAPDSWNGFAHWRRDADCLLGLLRTHGVCDFKIDGIRAPSAGAQANLQRFFDAVLGESQGRIVLDLDITAGARPGYFGAMGIGPLFVENRYTDWHNHWPHQTLRNLWSLARWIDPRRLRMEFLNHARNAERYADDPLAPSRYRADALFATVMMANPLGWFEVSNLPAAYADAVRPLVATWRTHRPELFAGTILPIGERPDGVAWTGFASLAPGAESGYALVFRELSPDPVHEFALAGLAGDGWRCRLIGGAGRGRLSRGRLAVSVPEPLGFAFFQLDRGAAAGRAVRRRAAR